MDQAVRQQDQHARGASAVQGLRDHQAGLDGLAQSDFVGQQQARRPPFGSDLRHLQLVFDQVDARAEHAPTRMAARGGAPLQCFPTQLEAIVAVHAPRHQARVGLRHRLLGVEFALGMAARAALVAQQPVGQFDPFDDLGRTADLDAIARPERGAQQGRAADRVHAQRVGTRKHDLHLAAMHAQYRAQPQLRLGTAEPALSRQEVGHVSARCPLARPR